MLAETIVEERVSIFIVTAVPEQQFRSSIGIEVAGSDERQVATEVLYLAPEQK